MAKATISKTISGKRSIKVVSGVEDVVTPHGVVPFEYDTKTFLKAIINKPVNASFTIDDIRKRIEILGIIDKATDTIDLTEADFELAKQNVLSHKWGIVANSVVDFVEQFEK